MQDIAHSLQMVIFIAVGLRLIYLSSNLGNHKTEFIGSKTRSHRGNTQAPYSGNKPLQIVSSGGKKYLILDTITPRGRDINISAELNVTLTPEVMINELTNYFNKQEAKKVDVRAKECPHCTINVDCYDEDISTVKPLYCQAHKTTRKTLRECLLKKPLLLIGDSRLRQMHQAISKALGYKVNTFVDDNTESKVFIRATFDNVTGQHLLSRLWHVRLSAWRDFEKFDQEIKYFEGQPPGNIIFNMASHHMRWDHGSSRGPLAKKLFIKSINAVMDWMISKSDHNTKIIYMAEFYPLINPDTIQFNVDEASQLRWYRDKSREEIMKRGGRILYWDSHLLADFEYFKMCSEKLTFGQIHFTYDLSCRDMWHLQPYMYREILLPQLFTEFCNW